MARAKIGVEFDPVNTAKVDAAFARLQAKAKGVDFGGGARSLEKLSRPLGKITGQASEFQKSLEASNARVLAFGASVVVINKLSQAFSALVTNTVKVEATFAKINTILGGTEKQLKQFGQGIFEVARNTGTAFDQVAEGALELARQGLSVEDSLSRVSTALKLVRVAGIDSQQAVAGLTAAIKGFEGAGLTVAAIGDKLAEVDTKFAVSTEDLINGLERASASARVAGVSFDELLAVITTVQERTQRGGAVIGNAFKTIFARLGRYDTLDALKELGIQVLDAEGNVRDAIPLFMDLATELDRLGLKSVKAGEIIQKVAGVRQRDILINLVEDINSEQSKFAQALGISANAAGKLDAKNEKLNKTLEALINNLAVSSQQLASTIGELGFADAAGDILKTFGDIVKSINNVLQGESIGSKFAQGLIKGVGSVLTGPGLGLIGAIFLKLFVDLAKFGATSLKSLLGINSAAQAQAALQQSVLQTLLQNENIQREILKLEGNKVAQEQLLLKIYNQQAAALARVQKAAATVTPGLFGKGFRGGEKGVGKAAGGYIPAEARDISRGVGGAHAGAKVVSIPNFAFGGGKKGTMIANSSEYYVPNYAGGGDAIFNQNMIKSMGMPKGARKIRAAGGYIPNFAKTPMAIKDSRFAMITPTVGGATTGIGKSKSGQSYQFPILGYDKSGLKLRNDKQITEDVRRFGVALATEEAMTLTGGKPAPGKVTKLGNAGAIRGLAGTIFEAAVSALIKGPQYDMGQTSTFDFVGNNARNSLAQLYPGLSSNAQFIEAKIGFNSKIGTSMANKIEAYRGGPNTITRKAAQQLMGMRVGGRDAKAIQKEFGKISTRGAGGYIPNFADGLMGAIVREKNAGLPISQIRINQSGKLRNAQNPMGLAVTNTRDEPTGKIPNYAKAGGDINSAVDGSIMKFFALQMAVSSLTTMFGSLEEDASAFEKGLAELGNATMTAVNAMMVMNMVGINPLGKSKGFGKGVTGNVGRTIAGMGPSFAKVLGPVTKVFFNLAKFAGPIGLGLTALNSGLKFFFDKNILQLLGLQATDAEQALKNFTTSIENATVEQNRSTLEKTEARIKELELAREEFNMQKRGTYAKFDQNKSGKELIRLKEQRDLLKATISGQIEQAKADRAQEFVNRMPAFQAERVFRDQTGSQLNTMKLAREQASLDASFRASGNMSEFAKIELELQAKLNDLQAQYNIAEFEAQQQLIQKLKLRENLEGVEAKSLETLIKSINNGTTLVDIEKKIKDLKLSSKVDANELYQLAVLEADERSRSLSFEEKLAKIRAKDAQRRRARESGVSGYLEQNARELREMEENFGRNMAESFENAMSDALGRVGEEGNDTIGKVLGNIALQFGKDLMAAQRQAAIKNISGNITNAVTSGGSGGGGLLSKGFNFVKDLFFASGGLVTGGSGVRDDVPARLNSGEYVIKKSAVQKYGVGFFTQLNNGNLEGFNQGGTYESNYSDQFGRVQGIDNVRTERFFTGAKKFGGYGHSRSHMFGGSRSDARLAKAREMDFFMPGTRGAGSIVGKENLLAFSQQTGTSGATDVIRSGPGGGFLDIELQSSRLTAFARRRMSPARQRLQEAQALAYDVAMQSAAEEQRVFDEHQNAKKARSEQFKADVKQAFVDATVNAISAGFNAAGNLGMGSTDLGAAGIPGDPAFKMDQGMKYLEGTGRTNMMDFRKAQSGGFQMYAAGGGASQGNVNSVLTAGEFVVSAPAAAAIGRGTLDNINGMRYSQGGAFGQIGGGSSNSKADVGSINITVNVDKDGNSSSKESGGDEKSKNMAAKIKEQVLNVINEEKRVSGSLFTRNK